MENLIGTLGIGTILHARARTDAAEDLLADGEATGAYPIGAAAPGKQSQHCVSSRWSSLYAPRGLRPWPPPRSSLHNDAINNNNGGCYCSSVHSLRGCCRRGAAQRNAKQAAAAGHGVGAWRRASAAATASARSRSSYVGLAAKRSGTSAEQDGRVQPQCAHLLVLRTAR